MIISVNLVHCNNPLKFHLFYIHLTTGNMEVIPQMCRCCSHYCAHAVHQQLRWNGQEVLCLYGCIDRSDMTAIVGLWSCQYNSWKELWECQFARESPKFTLSFLPFHDFPSSLHPVGCRPHPHKAKIKNYPLYLHLG